VIQLRACRDLADVEGCYPRIAHSLEFARRRVEFMRRRGAVHAAIRGPLAWLDTVVRDHQALDSAEGEAIREELRRIVAVIREQARA
jgi:hypothetical protein